MGVACLQFRGENFRGWRENREIRESFLPQKFPAIRYVTHAISARGRAVSREGSGVTTTRCDSPSPGIVGPDSH